MIDFPPETWASLITVAINPVAGLVGLVVTSVLAYLTAQLNTKVDEISVKAETVKNVLAHKQIQTDASLKRLTQVTHDVHTLVNSNMGIQLKINYVLADRIASLTNNKNDIAVAKEAHKLFDEHEARQHTVDEYNKSRP